MAYKSKASKPPHISSCVARDRRGKGTKRDSKRGERGEERRDRGSVSRAGWKWNVGEAIEAESQLKIIDLLATIRVHGVTSPVIVK